MRFTCFRFIRRLCGCNGGKTTNTLILILLVAILTIQIFGNGATKESRKRSLHEPNFASYDELEYSDAALETEEEIEHPLSDECQIKKTSQVCEYLGNELIGHQNINASLTVPPGQSIANSGRCLMKGGCYTPPNCVPRQRVAILIPYKDREAHLYSLLNYLHPMLQRQQIQYCVFIIEQVDDGRFNKGLVMNSGFKEIMKRDAFDCVVFHDVDMIPEDDRNVYLCQNMPTHLSPLIDKFNYELHYGTEYGGVTMMQPQQYVLANGYSNMFWGWGREDSDMEYRLSRVAINPIKPYNVDVARYSMIPHVHPWRFQNEKQNLGAATRLTTKEKLMTTKHERAGWDGVANVKYRVDSIINNQTFTTIRVDLRRFITHQVQIKTARRPLMTINPQEREPCKWVELPGKYLDAQFIKDNRRAFGFEEVQKICNELGQACAGFVKENDYSTGLNYFPREKAVITSTNRGKSSSPISYMKVCPGELSQNFPITEPVSEASYSAAIDIEVVIPLSVSLVYRDQVLFEGYETGIEHEWHVPFRANETYNGQRIQFETDQFRLPSRPGWYTVNAKISDRFDQTWIEWSYQFQVDKRLCAECDMTREAYIQELKSNIERYKQTKSSEGKFSRDEKRKLAYHFSFEYDEDDARSPSFKQFIQQRGTQPK